MGRKKGQATINTKNSVDNSSCRSVSLLQTFDNSSVSNVTPSKFKQGTYQRLLFHENRKNERLTQLKLEKIAKEQRELELLAHKTKSAKKIKNHHASTSDGTGQEKCLMNRITEIIDRKNQKIALKKQEIQAKKEHQLKELTFQPEIKNSQKGLSVPRRGVSSLFEWKEA